MIDKIIEELKLKHIPANELKQAEQIIELAHLLTNEAFQIQEAEVDDYKSVIFNFRIGKDTWDITMYNDYTFEILRNLTPFVMCDTVYALMKDLFTPVRYNIYKLHDIKRLESDAEDDFDYEEELIVMGLDDESDDSFCYTFN